MEAFEQNISTDAQLAAFRDWNAYAELCLDKWSRRPSYDQRTKRTKMVDWIHTEKVGRWDVPMLQNKQQELYMAVLLENQSLLQADNPTQTTDLALPTRFVLPMVRRIYAQIMQADWQLTTPMNGPTAYVFYFDFLRGDDSNNQNVLSVDYNYPLAGENEVPKPGNMVLNRATVEALKLILGVSWSTEAQEDFRAQLGGDLEQELINAFSEELARDLLARSLKAINTAAVSGTATGQALVAPWAGPNTQHTFPAIASLTITDYKQAVYATLINADTDYTRANRYPSDSIICGYGLAGFLQKINTATQATSPDGGNSSFLGITDYGTFAGRWKIQGTDMLPDNAGFLYKRNPTLLQSGFYYCPYVPIQVMDRVYASYDTTTGAYQNTDKWTRNIRERSGYVVTKPYAFQPILGPTTGLNQY